MISDHNDADFEEKVKQVSVFLICLNLWEKTKIKAQLIGLMPTGILSTLGIIRILT